MQDVCRYACWLTTATTCSFDDDRRNRTWMLLSRQDWRVACIDDQMTRVMIIQSCRRTWRERWTMHGPWTTNDNDDEILLDVDEGPTNDKQDDNQLLNYCTGRILSRMMKDGIAGFYRMGGWFILLKMESIPQGHCDYKVVECVYGYHLNTYTTDGLQKHPQVCLLYSWQNHFVLWIILLTLELLHLYSQWILVVCWLWMAWCDSIMNCCRELCDLRLQHSDGPKKHSKVCTMLYSIGEN